LTPFVLAWPVSWPLAVAVERPERTAVAESLLQKPEPPTVTPSSVTALTRLDVCMAYEPPVAPLPLVAERGEREKFERLYHEAQASIHELRTKLGHQSLGHDEIVRNLRREFDDIQLRLHSEIEALRAQLDLERATHARLLAAESPTKSPAIQASVPIAGDAPRKRGRPRKEKEEPEKNKTRRYDKKRLSSGENAILQIGS